MYIFMVKYARNWEMDGLYRNTVTRGICGKTKCEIARTIAKQ